ncbi:DNA polymerase III subunit gamma/tau [Flavobacterium ichthyis]|nr:DNA polymerase III subunit gamma/tau [Flavobacterium ichthyis]
MLDIAVKSPEVVIVETPQNTTISPENKNPEISIANFSVEEPKNIPVETISGNSVKVSALSLSSIKAKREMEKANSAIVRHDKELPKEPFSETDMLLQWNKYAHKLADKGQKILESLMTINDPVLRGTTIIYELPNEGSKIEFESAKHDLLGHLRGKLHNYDIDIEVIVNEAVENKFAFTPQDKYNRLNEINPNLDLLRKTFDLDF